MQSQSTPTLTGVQEAPVQPITAQQLRKFTRVLQEYKAGKARTEQRILASEQWWKLRNTAQEQQNTAIGSDGGFTSRSGWLHNVIVSKHADAMDAYPAPAILPREAGDKPEAQKLSAIIPCVLEQNRFEQTYSDVMWQKCKTGTGVYKVVWDAAKLNGLGDIGITQVNLLNIYWEPGVTDIQKGRYFFHTELTDKQTLEQCYPQLRGKLKGGQSFTSTRFLYDDAVSTADKATVIEVYYRTQGPDRPLVHYCKYVEDTVLFATENDPRFAGTGLYDHGLYPYVFDTLFPIEGSPCGYGYVDICRNPQTEIDLMKTAFVKNAMVGATPRYFKRADGGVNTQQFLDLSQPLVEVNGNLGEDALRQITFRPLDSIYVSVLENTIQELRQTSGNTDTSTGNVGSGVTAASAIAALQEASGKGSRDATRAAYRAYSQIVELVIELIRQFYDLPRQFRITGQYGASQYVSYTNEGLRPQHQGTDFGQELGYRLPVFDIRVSAQKKNMYTTVANNELALQLFKLGFFQPGMAEQALACLDLMDFDGKDYVMQKLSQNASTHRKLVEYMQLALTLAAKAAPEMVQGLSRDVMQAMGKQAAPASGGAVQLAQADFISGLQKKEPARVAQAREKALAAPQPGGKP